MTRVVSHCGLCLLALSVGCGSDSRKTPAEPPGPPTHLTGQIVLGSGASLFPALRVTARANGNPAQQNASALADGTGAFDFYAPFQSWATSAVDLIVDAPPGARRSFHPTMIQSTPTTAPDAFLRPLVVPESVTFTTKTFGATTRPFSVRAAFTAVCADATNANCNSFYPATWQTHAPELWPEAALPIPVAFNRPGSTGTITDADSIAVWTTIGQMHDALGRQLFQPVSLSSLAAPNSNGYSQGAVLISIDNTLSPNAGYTNWFYDGNGNLYEAKTRLGSEGALSSRGLLTHELLHALGFHHTCAWQTVMGGYGCPLNDGATIQDAAAFNLAWTLRATMIARQPTTTLGDAWHGEQQLEAGPIASLTPGPLASPIPYAPFDRRVVILKGRITVEQGAP